MLASNNAILFKNNKDEKAPVEELKRLKNKGLINFKESADILDDIRRIIAININADAKKEQRRR